LNPRTLGILVLAVFCPLAAAAAPAPVLTQAPSPDWRDQILYFVMPDRFFDGNPANSDQKAGEYNPADGARYSGGDLAGVTAKIDYIRGLGATGVWITPPVANQWWDPQVNYGGYHGYWAENFVQVDKHMGTLADYQTLSSTLHKNGMVLVQDIVTNHTGNFFHMDGDQWSGNPGSVPVTKPTQPPFDRNDATDPAQKAAGIYHWTGVIQNYNDPTQALDHQLADLDDLNTENPVVRAALKDSFAFWIKTVGVDGFRIDTVRYVPQEFWNDFHWSKDPKHPGIMTVARSLGKKDFFTFGEDWETTRPLDNTADLAMAGFLGTAQAPGMGSVLNFPLQADAQAVFGKGRSTDLLTYRFRAQARIFADPTRLVNFLDNHDMDRFLAGAEPAALRQALVFLLTIPGIPVLYYGTEQGFTETRASMFAQGWGSGGVDHFDTQAEGYTLIRRLADLRQAHREMSHGTLRVIRDAGSAGAFAFETTWKGKTALVAFNTAGRSLFVDNLATGLPAGTMLTKAFSLGAGLGSGSVTVGESGLIHLTLGPQDAVVFTAPGTPDAALVANLPMDLGDAVQLRGTLPEGVTGVSLVIDGNTAAAQALSPDASGKWFWKVVPEALLAGNHRAVPRGLNPDGSAFVGYPFQFHTKPSFKSAVVWNDPVGDDKGPTGTYVYPTNPSFARQNDLTQVELGTAGSNLQISLTMNGPLTTGWGPPNGFDHVAFYMYLNVPGAGPTQTALPFQNALGPGGFAWNRFVFVEGWNSRLFTAAKAGPQVWGTPVSPAARVSVDKARSRIDLMLEGTGLGLPATLAGTQVYVTTWDYTGLENSARPLASTPADYTYGGGTADGPKVMDDTPVLTVP